MNDIIVPLILDRTVKRKWINALRGGRYRKGKYQLRQLANEWELSYSCLGVACQLGLARPIVRENSVQEGFIPNDIQLFLKEKNDGLNGKRAWSFNKIANWIERNL